MPTKAEVLAELYASQASIVRMVDDAGMDVARVPLAGSALEVWSAVVREAEASNHLLALLVNARQEYPEHVGLVEVYGAFLDEYLAQVRRKTGAPLNRNGGLDRRTATNAHLVEMVYELRLEMQRLVDGQRRHRLRPGVLVSAFVVIPVCMAVTFSGYRGAWFTSDGVALLIGSVLGYTPLIWLIITQPEVWR